MQAELNAVWDKLLPALRAGALPPGAAGEGQLKRAVAGLEVRAAKKGK